MTALVLSLSSLDAKQLFNVKTVKVQTVNDSAYKDFYGYTKTSDENVRDIVLRYDAYVGDVYANKMQSYVKKGEPLFRAYSPEVYTAEQELIGALRINNKGMIESVAQKLKLLGVEEGIIRKIMNDKTAPEQITTYAPYSGYITQKKINQGSFAQKGSKLYELSDLSTLWMMVSVYEKDVAFVKNTKNAELFFDITDKPYRAKVDYIYPKVDAKTKSVEVRLVIDNASLELPTDAFAKVRFSGMKKEYLSLPKSAVLTKGDKHYVFAKGEFEGEYEQKEIMAKRLSNDTFEIQDGLKAGDEVVANALFMFDADAQINGALQ
jgi:Cu(I)/Ag(I) efflux system membrane fusion protein